MDETRSSEGSAASNQSSHDTRMEWPGNTAEHDSAQSPQPGCCLRLVTLASSVLPRKRRIAVLDSYPEVQLGRDLASSSTTPRIRLKEMEVSKLHATVYWDAGHREWAIVDMGSKHGTFVAPAGYSIGDITDRLVARSTEKSGRLSPSRIASMPRFLRHLDTITVGTSVFLVHIHRDLPCAECASQGESDIPLFAVNKDTLDAGQCRKREREHQNEAMGLGDVDRHGDLKKAMAMLKKSLLSRHNVAADDEVAGQASGSDRYIDRSAKRRALHPPSRGDTPGLPTPSAGTSRSVSVPAQIHSFSRSPSPTPSLAPAPAPLPDTNIGHRLLTKQGWNPGTPLGRVPAHVSDASEGGRISLIDPLQAAANHGKSGLGMPVPSTSVVSATAADVVGDWRARSKRRRWDEVQKTTM